jgi:hypothetical protein
VLDKILAVAAPIALMTAGAAFIAYATIGRLFRFHRPGKWGGGGQISLMGEFSTGAFFLCMGLMILQDTGLWAIPAIVAWLIGYVSQGRADRRHAAEEAALRERNAANHPGIFDRPPPLDIDAIPDDTLDVYDAGACTYLGRVAKDDIRALVERFEEPNEGPNDIFLLEEFPDVLPEGSLSPEFVTLLRKAFEERDYVLIRWMPPSREAEVLDANRS